MPPPSSAGWSPLLRAVAYVGIWTVPALISTSQLLLSYGMRGDDPEPAFILGLTLPGWYLWGLLAPLVLWMARRFPLESPNGLRKLPFHLAANVVLGGTWVALLIALRSAFGLPGATAIRAVVVSSLGTSLLVYWTLVLLAHTVRYRREREARARRESELAAQLADARLAALRSQLDPHFLFNTLNAVSAFIRADPDRAESMISDLADLLRDTLGGPGSQIVPLERELAFVDRYLSIQRTRLGDRLAIERTIPEELKIVRVPSMVLQPLVENAVEHGIARRREGGVLTLVAARRDGCLELRVADDGPGAPREALAPSGWRVGLQNTRDRLHQLYGGEASLDVENGPSGGFRARVVIPLSSMFDDLSRGGEARPGPGEGTDVRTEGRR